MVFTISEEQLFVLDQAGIALRGKVPSYIASHVVERYWKDEVGWWCLTQERTTPDKLSTWIGSRDWFDQAYVLLPGSMLWCDADSHSLSYVQKSPVVDTEWPGDKQQEMWLVEREEIKLRETAKYVTAVHITQYLFSDEPESPVEDTSPILLEWCKAKARRVYLEQIDGRSLDEEQRKTMIRQIADDLTPWDADTPEMIAYLIAEPWMLIAPFPSQAMLPTNRKAETIGDVLWQHIYLTLVAALEEMTS